MQNQSTNCKSQPNPNPHKKYAKIDKPQLIINADDFGYCPERSRAIIQLINYGKISSTSVIVNSPNIQQQAQQLINCINTSAYAQQQINNINSGDTGSAKVCVSVGLHLNLTQFHPLSQALRNSELFLIDQNTKVFKGKQFIYKNLHQFNTDTYGSIQDSPHQSHVTTDHANSNKTSKINLNALIQQQIHAQIQTFIKLFKFKPSHIDGHNHIHMIPQIAEYLCQVARFYGIYKIRMPIPYSSPNKKESDLSQNQNSFVNTIIQLSKQSRKIYDKYGFIYPDYFVGYNTMGANLTAKTIYHQLQYIVSGLNNDHLEISDTTIQIMVHPGYKQIQKFLQFTTCPFSQSAQRQCQYITLRSQQMAEITNNYNFSSFHSIKKKISQKSVVIYSKLTNCTGNRTTSLRLATILQQQLSFKVYFMDVPEIMEYQTATDYNQREVIRLRMMIDRLGIKFIIGVNLTRASEIIYKATHSNQDKTQMNIQGSNLKYKIPYILIIAGTDANITLQSKDTTILQPINKSIKSCQCLISLSKQMKDKVQAYLKVYQINKKVALITQSTVNQDFQEPKQKQIQSTVTTGCSELQNSQNTTLKIKYSNIKQNYQNSYIIFPTSFRPVKAVHHILPQLNQLIQKYKIQVFVLGPIIDMNCYTTTIAKLGLVKYLGCLPHNQYLKLLKNALVLINCSQSQGMSCSILQAFAARVPVIVRKNQGNCQLVQDSVNGYVYQTGTQFINKFQLLIHDYQNIKSKLCKSAYQKLKITFSYNKEKQQYRKLISKYFTSLISNVKIDTYQIQNREQKMDVQLQRQNKIQIMGKSNNLDTNKFTQQKSIGLWLVSLKNVHGVSPVNAKIFEKFFTYQYHSHQQDSQRKSEKVSNYFIQKILQKQNSNNKRIDILDIGCGCGVFGILFILNLFKKYTTDREIKQKQVVQVNIVFADIQKQSVESVEINIRTLRQILPTIKLRDNNYRFKLNNATVIQSNMFENLKQNNMEMKFDIILGNMPQTMFNCQQSKIDKNGGHDGFKLTKIMLGNYFKHLKQTSSILITLYSYMLNQDRYNQLVSSNDSAIQWISQTQVHRVRKQDYQAMEKGLSNVIFSKMTNKQARIWLQQDVFCVPACLKVIRKF